FFVSSGVAVLAWYVLYGDFEMTFGLVVLGSLLFMLLRYWKGVFRLFPAAWSLDALYNHSLLGLENVASKMTKWYMTGFLRDYPVYIYLFFVIVTGGLLIYTGAFYFDMSEDAQITAYDSIFVYVMINAGLTNLFAKSRLTAILLSSVLGVSMACY